MGKREELKEIVGVKTSSTYKVGCVNLRQFDEIRDNHVMKLLKVTQQSIRNLKTICITVRKMQEEDVGRRYRWSKSSLIRTKSLTWSINKQWHSIFTKMVKNKWTEESEPAKRVKMCCSWQEV